MEKAASLKTYQYISCPWIRSLIPKSENQAISAQFSKQVSLQFNYSHKIVLPATVVTTGVCCDVL